MFASMLMMLCGTMYAEEVTFSSDTDKGPAGTAGGSIEKDGITIDLTGGALADYAEYRIYKSQTLTVSSTVGNITKIEMTCSAEGEAKWGPGSFGTGAPEGYTFEGFNGTWEGDAASVAFTATSNQVRVTKLVVTYTKSDTPVQTQAAMPTFSPKGGEYEESVTVTLSHKNPEATIRYYFNDDTENIYTFEQPFTLTETTTVTAFAVDNSCDVTVSELAVETN